MTVNLKPNSNVSELILFIEHFYRHRELYNIQTHLFREETLDYTIEDELSKLNAIRYGSFILFTKYHIKISEIREALNAFLDRKVIFYKSNFLSMFPDVIVDLNYDLRQSLYVNYLRSSSCEITKILRRIVEYKNYLGCRFYYIRDMDIDFLLDESGVKLKTYISQSKLKSIHNQQMLSIHMKDLNQVIIQKVFAEYIRNQRERWNDLNQLSVVNKSIK